MGIENIARKTGFTKLEIKVILFLSLVLISGFAIKTFLLSENNNTVKYDYSVQDSLFLNIGNKAEDLREQNSIKDKNVDYKQEVLDFRKPKINTGNTKNQLTERSIDLNKATKDTFEKLPGIGPKTAEKIISYRMQNGGFLKLEDILNVNGIGSKKFNKIKKYLYIEK